MLCPSWPYSETAPFTFGVTQEVFSLWPTLVLQLLAPIKDFLSPRSFGLCHEMLLPSLLTVITRLSSAYFPFEYLMFSLYQVKPRMAYQLQLTLLSTGGPALPLGDTNLRLFSKINKFGVFEFTDKLRRSHREVVRSLVSLSWLLLWSLLWVSHHH